MSAAAEPKVSLVLADDHHIIRQSLKLLLESQSNITVVAEAANGIEALDLVEKLRPDLLVLDLFMPVLNGLEVLRRLVKNNRSTRAIILSMHANEGYVLEALKFGACAYVLKQSTSANLLEAVKEVMAGRRYLSPPLSERAIEAYMARASGETPASPLSRGPITIRETEVLNFVAEGKTNAEIARQLSISERTVEHHRASLMRKLKCRNKAELIRYALEQRERFLS
jgi:two-component system, NarL family, response regulator NreC